MTDKQEQQKSVTMDMNTVYNMEVQKEDGTKEIKKVRLKDMLRKAPFDIFQEKIANYAGQQATREMYNIVLHDIVELDTFLMETGLKGFIESNIATPEANQIRQDVFLLKQNMLTILYQIGMQFEKEEVLHNYDKLSKEYITLWRTIDG